MTDDRQRQEITPDNVLDQVAKAIWEAGENRLPFESLKEFSNLLYTDTLKKAQAAIEVFEKALQDKNTVLVNILKGGIVLPDEFGSTTSFKAEIDRLQEVVRKYCDRAGMSNAPAHLQQTIDNAMANGDNDER